MTCQLTNATSQQAADSIAAMTRKVADLVQPNTAARSHDYIVINGHRVDVYAQSYYNSRSQGLRHRFTYKVDGTTTAYANLQRALGL